MLDPSIKLFGTRIQVNGEDEEFPRHNNEDINESFNSDELTEVEDFKEVTDEETMDANESDDQTASAKEEKSPAMSTTKDRNPKSTDSEETETETDKDEKESNETKNSQQKQLKKPDKILPCPRCNSMDTKFCYYNNYNVNQPRHFCKSCQRYWTAGGTMRNVPVGAGRRKNKSSASRYCHITMSEALQAARLDVASGVHHPGMKTNGTVLTFGSDNPLSDSMASVLSIADKKVLNGTTRNGFHNSDHLVPIPSRGMESRDDHSSGSTVTASLMDGRTKKSLQAPKQQFNGFTNQMPCFQWPYMWNPAVPVPLPFCPSAFPMPMHPPPPYWNGTSVPWNVPWVTQCSPTQKSLGSNADSPTLGKHSRNGEIITYSDNDRSSGTATTTGRTSTTTTTVLVPKTLRIDDPDEAAKSSIWTTLGIKKDKSDPAGRGFFNSFLSNDAEKKACEGAPLVDGALKANPAALCRSITFHERA